MRVEEPVEGGEEDETQTVITTLLDVGRYNPVANIDAE